jgi:hypothetical protein
MPRPGAPIVYSVERIAALCHTLAHFDHSAREAARLPEIWKLVSW